MTRVKQRIPAGVCRYNSLAWFWIHENRFAK